MPRVSSPVFVGRDAELERLDRALDEALAGRPTTRLIAGEAGIGKSRLVAEFVGHARRRGTHVLVGDCFQLGETGLPYAPFVAALRPLVRSLPPERLAALVGPSRGELAHLLPDLGPVARREAATRPDASLSATATQARLFEIVLGLVRRLADERSVVLVLEDLHWADSSTRDLLRFLVRSARELRSLVVGTYRTDELHRRHPLRPLIGELVRLRHVEAFELAPFSADELAAQVAGITGERATRELVEAIHARSGGNPFFAEELVATGEVGLALPRNLRDTVEDRVRQRGADAQRIVRIASVAGSRVDHRLLVDVARLDEPALTEAVREAVEHHLLVPTGPDEAPGYQFRHALVQEAVYEELLPPERTQLHAAFADALERSRELRRDDPAASAAQLAHHWLMAHDLGRALPAAIAAGRAAAAAFAFPEARAFLERALELWPKVPPEALPTDVDRTMILEEAAEASAQAGDPRRSIDLVRLALAEIDPKTQPMRAGVLNHRLAWYLNEAGDWQSGVAAMERAVQLIPIDPPSPERARVLSDLAHSLMVRSRFSESLVLAEAALAISRAVGARVAEARALNALGLDLACRSDLDRGIPVMREGHELALQLGDPVAIFLTAVALGWGLDETARHAESLELALTTRRRIDDLGAEARFGGQLASKAARALYELGRWDEADRLIGETLASGPTRYAVRWLLSNRVRLRVHRGQLDQARLDVLSYESLGEKVVGPDPDLMNARRAELAAASGDPATARALVRTTLERCAEPHVDTDARSLMIIGLWGELAAAEAAREAGTEETLVTAVESATELVGRLESHAARVADIAGEPPKIVVADLALAHALASRIRGDAEPALWRRAVAERRALQRPYEIGRVLAEAAADHLAARDRDAGAAAVMEAHAIAVALGAAPLRQRVEALARRARIPLHGVDTADDAADRLRLTRREREVLALLAEGRSNRQIGERLFMAESTAGVHVGNILAKLGVSRRSEAAVVAHRMGLLGTS